MSVDGAEVAIAAITFAGALAAGFFKMVDKFLKGQDTLTKSISEMASSNRDIAKKMGKVADATEQGNKEAKERNGHLAELAIENTKHLLKAVSTIQEQKKAGSTIKEQKVEHQTVNSQEVKE